MSAVHGRAEQGAAGDQRLQALARLRVGPMRMGA